jgi:hypothetical protein
MVGSYAESEDTMNIEHSSDISCKHLKALENSNGHCDREVVPQKRPRV